MWFPEQSARGECAEIPVEHQQEFSNGVDDCLCKGTGISVFE
jgi:hypothetical protein